MTGFYSHFGLPNTPPYITNELPTGEVSYKTHATFSVYDDRGYAVQDTLQVLVWFSGFGVDEPVVNEDAIINGVIQTGYSGTITPNVFGGFDVDIIKDGVDGWGQVNAVTIEIYVDDSNDDSGYSYYQFKSNLVAEVLNVLPMGRNKVEIEFDRAIKVRPVSLDAQAPADKYTPVVWAGADTDGANPENFVLDRVDGGNLSGAGEAMDIVTTWAQENEDHSFESEQYIYSTHIWIYTDYQMTPRADYDVDISNVVIVSEPMVETTEQFAGYVVSQVPRSSLKFVESIPAIVLAEDDAGTGDLRKFLEVLQETFDRIVEDIDVFFLELCTVDRIRDEFINALLWDLGDPFSDLLDLTYSQKRKLAGVLVQMYREKGTCDGIVNAVRFFLGITLSGCQQPFDDGWRLDDGSYGAYNGPDLDELGVSTLLAPAEGTYRFSFWLLSPTTLTATQKSQISLIANYVKPAHTFYLGVIEP